MNPKASTFYAAVAPYVRQASAATGIPEQTIAAQWALESAYGTSPVARANNLAGIIDHAGGFRAFASYAAFTSAYVAAAKQSRYDAARTADPLAAAVGLGAGGWDLDHYRGGGGEPGAVVANVIRADQPVLTSVFGGKDLPKSPTIDLPDLPDLPTIDLPGLPKIDLPNLPNLPSIPTSGSDIVASIVRGVLGLGGEWLARVWYVLAGLGLIAGAIYLYQNV